MSACAWHRKVPATPGGSRRHPALTTLALAAALVPWQVGYIGRQLVTTNVTSFTRHRVAVTELPAQVVAVQETRLTQAGQQSLQRALHADGWQAVWGKPQPIRKVRRGNHPL